MQIWKPCDKKWCHNDIITKNNEKMWTSAKTTKLYIIQKVLMRAIQKSTFYWIWVTISNVMGIYVKFWHFLRCPLSKCCHVTWPKKQISKKIYFFLILHLILDKAAKFLVEKLCTSEVISQKPHGGEGVAVILGLTNKTVFQWGDWLLKYILFGRHHSQTIERIKSHMTVTPVIYLHLSTTTYNTLQSHLSHTSRTLLTS